MASSAQPKPKRRGEIPAELREIREFQRLAGVPGQNFLLHDSVIDTIESLPDPEKLWAEAEDFRIAALAGLGEVVVAHFESPLETDEIYLQFHADWATIKEQPKIDYKHISRNPTETELDEIERWMSQGPLDSYEQNEFEADAQAYFDSLPELGAQRKLRRAAREVFRAIQTTEFESPADGKPVDGYFVEDRRVLQELPIVDSDTRKPKRPNLS